MPLEVSDLASLSTDNVEAWKAYLAQALSEYRPTVDLRRGVVHDLVLHPSAVLAEAVGEIGRRLLLSDSFAALDADPTLADEDVVDRLFSRWRVSRRLGERSRGPVLVVVEVAQPVVISQGAGFRAGALRFVATSTTQARAEADNVLFPSDRLLERLSDGRYGFVIEVEADAEGEEYRLTRDALLLPEEGILGFVRAQVLADFSPGRGIESNAEVAQRFREGAAAKTLSNRVTMSAALREVLPGVAAQSIVGFGDEELLRATHSLLPIAVPGRVDWYVQTEPLYRVQTLSKTATLVAQRPDGTGEWQVEIGRGEAPGFYDVASIRRVGETDVLGGFPILADVRGVDLSQLAFAPDVVDPLEGVYSAYQTAVVRFHDTATDASALTPLQSQADYDVAVRLAPSLDVLQEWAAGEDVRYHGGDALLKAAVPCFVSAAFRVKQPASQEAVDLGLVRREIAAAVNALGFSGQLPASLVADVARDFWPSPAVVSGIELLGTIRFPDGSYETYFSRDVLSIPWRPSRLVTARTTVFYLAPADIGVEVT